MRSANTILSVAAIAGLAAASPAPQQLNFNDIASAQTVATGPAFNGVVAQTASIITTVAVTTTATASVTGQATTAAVQKRHLEERTVYSSFWCTWFGIGCSSSSTSTTSSSVVAKTTSTSVSSTKAATTSSTTSVATTSAATTSAYTPYYPALATVTQYTTGTTTISSTSSCPTTPEEGTYCGFINPEDPCAPQPDGYGPVPTPDTVSAFLSYAPFHSMASAAPTSIAAASVSGVAVAYQQTFKDLNAASSAQSYLGLKTLQTYNAAECAAYCDATSLCTAFNLYIERDPSVAPSANDSTAPTVWGYWCPNPASMTSYKCTIWGSNLDASTATNAGQWREEFNIVITGSSGWDKTNVTVPTTPTGTNPNNNSPWSSGTNCSSKAINAPSYWMGSKFFPGPFNSQICADYALAQNKANKAQAQLKGQKYYTPCNMFNSYFLHKNNKPHGTYCALYDTDVSTKYATYSGGVSGSDSYSCRQSFKFALKTYDSGAC